MKITPLTLEELKAVVAEYVTAQNLSSTPFETTSNNVAGLLDKIGKITMLSQNYIDKLGILDREFLSYGKTIEEWCQDLCLPEDYDPEGANALAPNDPSYRPVFYSYTLGRKTFSTTRRYNEFERAVHNDGELMELIDSILNKLYSSERVWRYQVKREILGQLSELCTEATSNATTFATSKAYAVGQFLTNGTDTAVVFQAIPSTNSSNWATLVENGSLVVLDLVTTINEITDTASGEAFIKQVKADIEIASDNSQGHSLNGNAVGAIDGLVLIVKQGIMPIIEVDVQAGAFHESRVAVPAEIIVVPDFGSATNNVQAILMDRRACGLHPTYRAVREQNNGKGDFINYYLHTENTGYISRNAFVKIYVTE